MEPRSPRRLAVAFGLVTLALLATACALSSPGARIFQLGEGHSGAIPRSAMGGPYSTSGPGCAFCHGDKGQGTGQAPSITRATLGSSHSIRHMRSAADQNPAPVTEGPWTAAQTVEVVRTGVTPEGNHLGGRMPRWQLDTQDGNALAGFLGTL